MTLPASPSGDHDHGTCVADAIARAEALCAARGKRLTPVRRRVLELVWADHKPVSAYDILEVLMAEGWGSSPPVAYRALSFLADLGLVHKLERRNAFIGCPRGGDAHVAQFFICTRCDRVTETAHPGLSEGLGAAAAEAGFTVTHPVIEVEGVCGLCRGAA